jgi:hypothetical protein
MTIEQRLLRLLKEEPLLLPHPRQPLRHLYHAARHLRHTLHSYRPSSNPIILGMPGETVSARVQWAAEEGRAGFEGSAAVVKRREKEGEHLKRMMEIVKKRDEVYGRVYRHFSG